MRVYVYFYLMIKGVALGLLTLTVVNIVYCSQIFGAPPTTSPNLDEKNVGIEAPKESTQVLEPMDVTEPPPETKKTDAQIEKEYFYSYSGALGPRLGLTIDPVAIQNRDQMIYLLGFYFRPSSLSSRHYEFGLDLKSNSTGALNIDHRWTFNATGKFRPFTKAGIMAAITPDKGLANFLDHQQYYLKLGGGFEDLLQDPLSLRWDIEFIYGYKGYAALIVFGYSWAW